MPEFVFAVCQLGAEGALKQELAREHPELRFAYSRPGFLTLKNTGASLSKLRSVFARASGASLGAAADPIAVARGLGRGLRLHVWERDAFRPGEEPPDFDPRPRVAAVVDSLRSAAPALFLDGETARPGDQVLDVITAPGEPPWLGTHVAGPDHSPHPGGRIPVTLPAEAPSRAYLKLVEALSWSGAPLRQGDVAVEVGSAPGGASWALLERGLEVTGVDPGAMDARVLAHPRYKHVAKTVADVRREELPPRAQWILLDVNLAPQVALHAIRRIVSFYRPSLRGVLFTLKLNDWALAAEVPSFLARVAGMGMSVVRATQLPSNRQEIFVQGLTASSAR